MAKCHRNNYGSLALEKMAKCHRDPVTPTTSSSSSSGSHFRLWSTFSGSAFRRKIFDAVSCGGGSRYRAEFREEYEGISAAPPVAGAKSITIGAALKDVAFGEESTKSGKDSEKKRVKSEKLSDLLNLAELETDVETRKKEEALEELKRVVKELQVEVVREDENGNSEKKSAAALKVRLLAKEDSEARVTLAMLGAIPPLVGMVDDSHDVDTQIASLYALLNLGIGNDP